MMISVWLLLAHFIGDFVLQMDWMAQGKSKNTKQGLVALTTHVIVYASCFAWLGPMFTAVTFLAHWVTDFIMSRITSRLFPFVPEWDDVDPIEWYNMDGYEGRSMHYFFVVIGLDQLIHYVTLAITYEYLFSR